LEIVCWSPVHNLFSYIVALPALIVWGLCLPALAFYLMRKRQQTVKRRIDEDDSWMFLAGGYKSEYYYWEMVLVARKVILICLCDFISNYGVLTQALLLLLVLILFLVMTARKRPQITDALFDLEAMSLGTLMLTVYCALFFLADTSERVGATYSDQASDVTFSLSTSSQRLLVFVILAVNAAYFLYWVYRTATEMEGLRGFVLRTCPNTVYLALFACGDRDQAYLDKQKQILLDDNMVHKDEYLTCKRAIYLDICFS
jgi:hypothetical protein